MTIKGRLIYSTAIVKRFQAEQSPSEWQAPLPVIISQLYVVLENHRCEDTRSRQKFDDIFIRFDTIPACDRQPDRHDDSNSRAYA